MAVFSSGIHSAPALEPELVTTSPTSTTVTSADSALPAQPLAIEAPPASDTIKLDVGTSEPVSLFDQLGPMIVSKEGTLSRIGNWQEMDELERARVLRVLGKRNEIRLTARRAEGGVQDDGAGAGVEGKS